MPSRGRSVPAPCYVTQMSLSPRGCRGLRGAVFDVTGKALVCRAGGERVRRGMAPAPVLLPCPGLAEGPAKCPPWGQPSGLWGNVTATYPCCGGDCLQPGTLVSVGEGWWPLGIPVALGSPTGTSHQDPNPQHGGVQAPLLSIKN